MKTGTACMCRRGGRPAQATRSATRLSGHAFASVRQIGIAHQRLRASARPGLKPIKATMTTTRPPAAAAGSEPVTIWKVAVSLVTVDKIPDLLPPKPPLTIAFIDAETGDDSEYLDFSAFTSTVWKRSTGNKPGHIWTGTVEIPSKITPGALSVKHKGPAPDAKKPNSHRIWVEEVKLSAKNQPDVTISAYAWVNTVNSPRVFFTGKALLPSETPAGLKTLRDKELNIIKGVGDANLLKERHFSDRIEDYDVYNDLGHLPVDPNKQKFDSRPVLGGMIDQPKYKYPRRLRTGRPTVADKANPKVIRETNPPDGNMWVPQDKDFDQTKAADFQGDAVSNLILPIAVYQLKTAVSALHKVKMLDGPIKAVEAFVRFVINVVRGLKGQEPLLGDPFGYQGGVWNSFEDVMSIYGKHDDTALVPTNIAAQAKVATDDDDEEMRQIMRGLDPETRNEIFHRKGIPLEAWQAKEKVIKPADWASVREQVNESLHWEVPLVAQGAHTPPLDSDGVNPPKRTEAWETDEEYGRQFVAGQNPLIFNAPSALPKGCSITGTDIDGLLEGGDTLDHLLSTAGSEPKLFLVDYMEPYRTYASRIDAQQGIKRKQHAGRLLLYKKKSTGHLLPVAIELWYDDGSTNGKTTVYTPANSHKNVWLVAKAIFASLDCGIHQLVSHLLRTHVCQEPYILAADRCLSVMHPVYKLLTPHFVYTLRMNANARTTLINQPQKTTGILEATFTPGKYTTELSAVAYESWKFKEQGLPHDLIARGVAKPDGDGGVKLLLDDYPYAEDGLLIWNALKKWNDGYLKLYYKDNKAVADDAELQAWWTEILTKGHPDADPAGWPDNCKDGIKTVADLSDITTTMAYMGSAHHAAVNFAQYDYTGLTLNRSPLIRDAIPEKGSPAYQALTSDDPKTFQQAFLTYIANPFPATVFVALMTVLSQHAPNEHFLSDSDQGLVYDPEALKLHNAFVADMVAAEDTINKRNAAGTSVARSLELKGLPYNYLMPSSPQQPDEYPNITGRGIPYSISI